MMFGFACDETEELMPLPISLAHRLATTARQGPQDGTLPFLRPDGKSQVSVRYRTTAPSRSRRGRLEPALPRSSSQDPDRGDHREVVIKESSRPT
jgi:S-adenosylmethionine synthetase